MELLNKLQWRYATKRFDKNRKLNSEQVNNLLQAANLAPSSFGLQPFAIVMVDDEKIKEKLSPAGFNQPQITEASHLFIFAVRTDLSDKDVDEFVERIVKTRDIVKEDIADYEKTMKSSINKRTPEQRFNWAARQAYISLGFLLSAAAMQDIDACPMEGFSNERFDEILGLKEKGFSSVAMAAAGYRSPDDAYQQNRKVRKSLDEFVIQP
ncbi:NAD(P)H-dependent oxidoreductase [Anaerophaga thermohalophila]|jgi:nitroreductase|uniref:NAD(P)H-dependent oxidoreductase n=1 Tax=Anaerophaga thermohalophila TaxID=177400 RepID=UPI00031BC4EC|nr:NAD(P)H-dependent oxidoreductase [Anaerophaga thermohalophila]